jgi:hypothetical protein
MENVKVVIRSHQSKKDIQYKGQKRHTIQWPTKTYNTMAKKDIQYNGHKRHTIQWPKKTYNIMAKKEQDQEGIQ